MGHEPDSIEKAGSMHDPSFSCNASRARLTKDTPRTGNSDLGGRELESRR
jgi:hypothetical protein